MQNAINNLLDIVEGNYYLVAQLVITSVLGAVWLLGSWSPEVYAILGMLSLATSMSAMLCACLGLDD